MIRTFATTAIVTACAGLATLTGADAAPRATQWYECQNGWQPHQCAPDGVQVNTQRARRIVLPPRPQPQPAPVVARFEIKPEGNGSVAGGGGSGGGGGGGGGGR